ncbi:MAG: Hpt domain-containing protein, partial [Janthinobacterium lividum]
LSLSGRASVAGQAAAQAGPSQPPVGLDTPVSNLAPVAAATAQDAALQAVSPVAVEAATLVEPMASIMARFRGNVELFNTVTAQIGSQGKLLLDQAAAEMAAGNYAAARVAMHTLKGTAGTVGASALSGRAAILEKALKRDDFVATEQSLAAIDDLRICLDESAALLAAYGADALAAPPVPDAIASHKMYARDWRARLGALAVLLKARNLGALDIVETTLALPDWIDETQFILLSKQIHNLEFEAATATLNWIRRNA